MPHWQTELKRHQLKNCLKQDEPLALVNEVGGILRLAAVCAHAQALGLRPTMALTDARALIPTLKVATCSSADTNVALAKLADWATRFTPWVAMDGIDSLWLDITGCSDLFGNETVLLERLRQGLTKFKITAHVAAADTPGAAWAMAHFTTTTRIPPKKTEAYLNPLPISSLRLSLEIVKDLELLGIRCIRDLLKLPRASLSSNFDHKILIRLDQAVGRIPEPISPRRSTPTFFVRHAYAEPIITTNSLTHTLNRLLPKLCQLLKKKERGVRKAILNLFQIDGTVLNISVGTNRKVQEPRLLSILFMERLKSLNLCLTEGNAIEAIHLTAAITERLQPTQSTLKNIKSDVDNNNDANNKHALADLMARLTNRLPDCAVIRFTPHQSHIPERAVEFSTSILPHSSKSWTINSPRPIHLFRPAIPIEVMAMLPDNPPILFKWQNRTHHVARAVGPERITGEWWHNDSWTRDYYQIEDLDGGRFWLYQEKLYRENINPRWWLHGLFA